MLSIDRKQEIYYRFSSKKRWKINIFVYNILKFLFRTERIFYSASPIMTFKFVLQQYFTNIETIAK